MSPRTRRFYLRVRTRFLLSVLVGLAWAGFSTWLALPWIADLGASIGVLAAIAVVAGIALVPGYLNMQLAASLLLDRPPPLDLDVRYPAITVIVAAYNEADQIEETVAYACAQDYPGRLEVLVVDDGSTDATAEKVSALVGVHDRLRLLAAPHGGKAHALQVGLAAVTTPMIATIDADTLLMPTSLRRAVARLVLSPPDTVAVAGSVMARNTRESFMTRVQQWDYFIGIAAVKRQQAFLQGTLVAQGAFSVYETAAVKLAGGWPDRIGEDIVLTWSLLRDGGRVTYEPTAIAFTDTPTGLHALARQRQRWARGMIEGLREHGFALLRRPRMYSHSVAADLLFPYLDTVYSVAVPIGLALALTGNFAIIGPLTLAVLPINFLIALLMFRCELPVFRAAGFRVRRRPLDVVGLTCYGLFLQLLLSPVCVVGYAKELFGSRRSW